MKEFSLKRLEKAAGAIEGARRDLEARATGLAADRAYYAMFYTAEALLADRGLGFSKHGAVHGAFGKEFAKTDTLDPKFHRWLLEAFAARQDATYGVDAEFAPAEVVEMIGRAEEFLTTAREFLHKSG